uniref:Ribonuclease H-like domain-containing protein n=1 Tax=Tanacetum cinerariifolium TaxID=118510 RepID=A0A6L2MXB3_TANCI|nr:ribonuclease H-like domain-containing protein [Tanacetum cinerariifolium]
MFTLSASDFWRPCAEATRLRSVPSLAYFPSGLCIYQGPQVAGLEDSALKDPPCKGSPECIERVTLLAIGRLSDRVGSPRRVMAWVCLPGAQWLGLLLSALWPGDEHFDEYHGFSPIDQRDHWLVNGRVNCSPMDTVCFVPRFEWLSDEFGIIFHDDVTTASYMVTTALQQLRLLSFSTALHGWYYMVFVTTVGEEYDKVFNHLDMLNVPFKEKVFTCTKQVKPYVKAFCEVMEAIGFASTHLVKESRATIMYLTLPGAARNGLHMSIPYFKNGQGADSDSDVEEDTRSNSKFLADLKAEFHDRARLVNQKRYYKSVPAGDVSAGSIPARSVPAGGVLVGSLGSTDSAASSVPAASVFVHAVVPTDSVANSPLPPVHSLGSCAHTTRFPSPSDLGNHKHTAGIFSSSSYDDEFFADVTNLDSNVVVDHVATKRNQNRTNHADHLHCLFACFLSQLEPSSVSTALVDPDWVAAMQEEMQSDAVGNYKIRLSIVPAGKYVVPAGRNGNNKKSLGRYSKGRVIILPPVSFEEHVAVQREIKEKNLLLQSLPEDHMADFHHLDDAREIWLAVKARFGGNEESKKMRKTMLKQTFSEFSVSEEEGLHKGYDRFQKILSQLNQMQAKPDNDDVNIKFLRALPPSWSQVALTLKTRGGFKYLSFDDLYNKLRSLEIDVKGRSNYGPRSTNVAPTHSAFIGAASTNTKMVYSEQPSHSSSITYTFVPSGSIIEDLGHFARECNVKKVDEKARYSAFKISKVKTEEPKAMVSVDSMLNWNEHEAENKTEEAKQVYGLMAKFESDFVVHAGNAAGSVNHAAAEFAMMGISRKAKLKKNEWEVKFVESLARTKFGLGFKEYIGSDDVCDLSTPSVFDPESENREVKSLYESDKSSASETYDFTSCVSSPKTNDSFFTVDVKILPKSDVKDPSLTNGFPSYSFKENVKPTRNLCNKSGIADRIHCKNNFVRSKKCFVCGSKSHLIKDCHVHDTVDNFPSVVLKAASVPTGSRNSSASTSAGRSIPAASRNKSTSIHAGRSISAASRNRSASIHADRSIPAASRNRPASIHARRHIPAGRIHKPAPFPAGRFVPTGWTNHAARTFFRPTNLYFDYASWPGIYDHISMKEGRWGSTVKSSAGMLKSVMNWVSHVVVFYVYVYPYMNKDIGIVDSGFSRSMTGNKEKLDDFVQVKGGTVTFGGGDGLPLKLFTNEHNCVACNKEKQHKASYKAIFAMRTIFEPLQLLHMDLFGPTSIRSIDHKYYSLVVTDDFSRFSWAFFLGTKDETFYILKDFIALIENQLNKKVKAIRCDNGTEFQNAKLIALYKEKGIKRDYSNARTPQQNRVAERKNRTLIEAARSIKKVKETLNLRYLEDKPNVQGLGQEWYFDLDYLTDSLGYTRFKTNPPAGTHDTNIIAGTQDDDSKSECDEQVILVPFFPSNSFSGPKVHDVSAPMENNLNYAEELARIQRQEHEAHSAAAMYGFEFSNDTASMLHQAEIKTRRNLVLAARDPAGSIVSTGGVPAGSVPTSGVPAGSVPAGSIPASSVPAGSIVSTGGVPAGSVPAGSIPASSVPAGSVPASHFPTSSIPAGGVLAGSIDSAKFGDPTTSEFVPAVFTTDPAASSPLPPASNVAVDPIATKRVNTIHPKSQIIGELQSPVHTRSTMQKFKFGESAFISYVHHQNRTNHADHLHCLFTCFLSQLEPRSVAKALKDPDWVAAMQEEMQQFYNQQVWKLVPLPGGKIAIGTK